MHSLLATLDGFGGTYIALFVFAIVSGVFVLANAETAVFALGAASSYSMPKLLVLAAIAGVGQSVTHAILFQSARRLTRAGATHRPWLESKIAKAKQLGARWEKSELLLMALGATVGVPPQALIALLAGAIDIRFRTFVSIDVPGRILRFVFIVVVAHQF